MEIPVSHKKIACPCCENFTIDYYDTVPIIEICPVCFWQYDSTAQKYPDRIIGPNHGVSLNQAKKNYKNFGVFDEKYTKHVRVPAFSELPENNTELITEPIPGFIVKGEQQYITYSLKKQAP